MMKLLKRINQASAVLAGLSFLVMVQSIYVAQNCPAYYVSAVVFLVMAALFLPTAAVFLFRSLLWHIKNRKMGALLRHYIYAYIGFYLLLMVLDHISMRSISWGHNLVYALVLGLIQIYTAGMSMESGKKVTKSQPPVSADAETPTEAPAEHA